jgi:hypothetical protein
MCKRDTAGFLGSGRRKADKVKKRILCQLFVVLLLLSMPLTGFAEDLRLTTKVQVMPITGTSLADAEPILEAMIAEVQRTEGFVIVQSTGMTDGVVNPTDASPEAEYSVSGTLVEEVGDTLFQISLWRLSDSSLLLSEELVYVDLEEALDLVPILVWSLLGNIPSKTMPIDGNWRTNWLYLGLLTGASLSYDKLQGWDAKTDKELSGFKGEGLGLSPSAALTFMMPVLNIPFRGDPKVYLEVQTEVLFAWEWAGYSYHHQDNNVPPSSINKNGVWTDEFSFFSFTFPLLVKVEFNYGPMLLAPYGGAYFYLPLGEAQSKSNRTKDNVGDNFKTDPKYYRGEESLQVSIEGIPLGWTLGFYTGIKMGPGALIIDLRYSRDIGTLAFKDKDGNNSLNGQYLTVDRNKFSLMVGYEIGLFKRERDMEVHIE